MISKAVYRFWLHISQSSDKRLTEASVKGEKGGEKSKLPDGESNPGLPRDRRGYSPLYYQGFAASKLNVMHFIFVLRERPLCCQAYKHMTSYDAEGSYSLQLESLYKSRVCPPARIT